MEYGKEVHGNSCCNCVVVAVVVFFALTPYRLFSRDVTGAMLVFLNNRTAAMLVSPTIAGGIQPLLSCKRFVLFRWKNKITDHVSENTVIQHLNNGNLSETL